MKRMKSMTLFTIVIAVMIGFSGTVVAQDTKSIIVTETGNVGVGVTSPDVKLEVNGDVKSTGRIKDKTGFIMPVGTILPFGGTTAPEGWLLCDGAALDRNGQYKDLFEIIGTAFGTPDVNTFNVPDLRGQFLRGVDAGTGVDPDVAARTEAKPGGNTGDNVGSKQADEFKSHTHGYIVSDRKTDFDSKSNGAWVHRTSSQTSPTGGNETRPKNIFVNYIIKY